MYLILLLSIVAMQLIYYVLLGCPLALIVYMFCRKPFKSRWVSARYFVNNLGLFTVLVLNVVMMNDTDDALFHFPWAHLVLIIFVWLFNLVVLARETFIYCKYREEENYQHDIKAEDKKNIDESKMDED